MIDDDLQAIAEAIAAATIDLHLALSAVKDGKAREDSARDRLLKAKSDLAWWVAARSTI